MKRLILAISVLVLAGCGLPRDIVGPTDGGPSPNERPPNRG
jgi:uncharacterized lipoprotein YajG